MKGLNSHADAMNDFAALYKFSHDVFVDKTRDSFQSKTGDELWTDDPLIEMPWATIHQGL